MTEKTPKYQLFPPTETQSEIIENYLQGHNQIVTAVPGAGKTTLALLIANVPKQRILVITFSKRLSDETQSKAMDLGLTGMEVRTFHSLGCHYYSPTTRCDLDLLEIYDSDGEPCRELPTQVDCVILDEVQDMCREQFLFCYKFLMDIYRQKQLESSCRQLLPSSPSSQDHDRRTRLIIMGDVNQCIFPYKGADPRYLSRSEELWNNHCLFREMTPGRNAGPPPAFRHVSMNGTNRLTGPMVQFLNFNQMCVNPEAPPLVSLKSQRLTAAAAQFESGSGGDGSGEKGAMEKKVQYWRLSRSDMIFRILKKIQTLLRNGEGKPGDIFIICPSIHKNFIAKEILNELTELGYPCFYPNQDDSDKTHDQVLLNKICFLTGHSSKGRERRFCFLLGFDSSYYQFMDRDAQPSICTNLLYVACTRATEELILCEFYVDNQSPYYQNRPQENRYPLPFLKMTSMGMLTNEYSDFLSYFGEGNMNDEKGAVEKIMEQREERGPIKLHATDMVNFLSTSTLEILNARMKHWWIQLESAHPEINITPVISCGVKAGGKKEESIQEDVSDLNGLAIPSIFLSRYFRDTPGYLYERLADRIEALEEKRKNSKHVKMLVKLLRQLPREGVWQWDDYLKYFAMEQAFGNQVFHRIRQITDYDWLEADTVQNLMEIFEKVLGEEMVESRRKGIRPFLEYDLFSSFSFSEKKRGGSLGSEDAGGGAEGDMELLVGGSRNIPITPSHSSLFFPGDGTGGEVVAAGSLESRGSVRSYMGSVLSSSSDEVWEEKEVEVVVPEGGFFAQSSTAPPPTKSEYFHDSLLRALKRLVEESEEYQAMSPELQARRRWYDGRQFVFSGSLDLVTYRAVWEMKCTSMLSKEHQLQLLLYAWFWKGLEDFYQKSPESFSDRERKYVAPLRGDASSGKKEFHLFNVKTREHLQLKNEVGFEELTELVALWVDGKYNSSALSVHLSDSEFLRILEEV
jgi:hypothetical protein